VAWVLVIRQEDKASVGSEQPVANDEQTATDNQQ
jgi:hypothetical protein